MRFKLMAGGHTDENGKSYHAKDPGRNIIKTDLDLVKKFGDKFKKLSDSGKDDDGEDDSRVEGTIKKLDLDVLRANYEAMTVDELKKFADAEEIDLDGATKKADIVAAIMLHEEAVSKA